MALKHPKEVGDLFAQIVDDVSLGRLPCAAGGTANGGRY